MSRLTDAVARLRPGVDFSDTNGTLPGIRWDTPDVEPPSRQEIDAALLAIDCEARCDEIDALHEAKSRHGFTYQGTRFNLDDVSQGKIGDLATAAGFFALGVSGVTFGPTPFVAADDSAIVFATAAEFLLFANAAKNAAQALFARRYALKMECRAAATAEELAAIDIEASWPEI